MARKYARAGPFDNAGERRYFPPVIAKNWIEAVHFGDDGLVPVVAQSSLTGEVLMLAYADREALERTRDTGEAHYHSRSRGVLWKKGETSGHRQEVQDVLLLCREVRAERVGDGEGDPRRPRHQQQAARDAAARPAPC